VNASLLDPLALRGKTEAVPAFRVLDVTPGATPMARRLDSPMVGRERELSLLHGVFDQATGRRVCAVATVMGDAGLGKSRLVGEFVSQVDPEARVLSGRCLPYGEGITFWPIGEVVREAAGLFEDDTPEEARVKIARLLVGHEDADLALDRVASAIGLSEAGGEIQETFWAVRRLLEALAGVGPLVIVFDDIHWAEAAFLDLVQYLAAFSAGYPILLLCTARPDLRETRPDWGEVATMVTLEPLTKEQSEQLISNLLGRAGVAGDVRTRITEAAEGNPLFVEEMLRMLIDDGLLVRDNGHWQTHGDLAMVSVPGTIQALLSARLERLDREERGVIQRASVVGKVFWWGAVAELSPSEDRSHVGPRLQSLLRKELVLPDISRFAGEDAFRFSHILVRDAAYESMPKSIRADLHERFVTWLERKAGDRIPEYEEIL
jgi:predicted ATPase